MFALFISRASQAGNRHLATYNGGADISHSDWLGTERNRDAVTSSNQIYTQNLTSLPFGDWLDNGQGLGADWTPLNFTGQYHDFESNLDYFGARYYSNSQGRFMSPDWSASPEPVPYGELGNPQSLNLYSYVKNNPLNATDLDGHCTKDGKEHGYWWCLFHYSDQDALHDASNFFHNNDVRRPDGSRINPDKLSDKDLLQAWNDFNAQWRAAVASGANPAYAMAGFFTQWGWSGQPDYNEAKDLLNEVNTPQGTVDRKELLGKVPTKEEALHMISDAKGQITSIEETGHAEGGVTPHTYPHINYTTKSGVKGTIKINP